MSDDMPVNYEGQFKAFMIETQGIEPKGSYKLVTNNNFDENDNNDINEMDNNNLDENDLDEQINADIEKENLMSMNDVEQEKEIKLKECMEKLNIPQIIKDALDEIEEEEKQLKLKILHKLGDNYKNDAINHPIYTFYKNDFFKENPQIFSNELNSQINEYKSNPKLDKSKDKEIDDLNNKIEAIILENNDIKKQIECELIIKKLCEQEQTRKR